MRVARIGGEERGGIGYDRWENGKIRTACAEVAGLLDKARYEESSLTTTLIRLIPGYVEICAVILFMCGL